MGFYSLSRSNITLSTSNDSLTFLPATGRSIQLIEFSVGGMATTATAQNIQIARSSGGTTPSAGVTAQPLREAQAAAGFTNATAWVAQPTINQVLLRIPCNAHGGLYRWIDTEEMTLVWIDGNTSEQMSIRGEVGAGSVSFHCIVEEW